ncbi:hypothetical protein E1B28_011704 [Marasmius oreades]|uniref:Uncharacterized protein n=1 Tax=Marasmius oreades TaxID=181124 RepID=A0A9P7RUU7_9AGAR|nr:uncharacterized protein E1B28_011704 [Marasmius oreades]KAG7090087.1 hypothetical protein E1B28_011704 [Marasmius oreades]
MAPSPLVTLFFVGWTHILLYGVNAVLFIVGMYLLRQRKAREGTMFLVVSSSVLFALATVSAIISTSLVVGEYLSIPLPGTSPTSINLQACSIIEFVLFGLIDLTAFIILVYRSFHIWDRRYLVIVVPVLLFLGASALYYYELHQYLITQQFVTAGSPAGLITTTFVYTTTELSVDTVSHALLTYLIARRIWTLKTCLQDLGHEGIAGTLPQKYNSIIAITLESGMIIPTFTIIFTVFNVINAKTGAHGDVTAILSTIMPQIYALAPLIIMMRVTLGLTVERYNAGNPTVLSSLSFGARTSQGRGSLLPALNVHGDGSVPVSGTSPSDLQDLEQNSVSKGQAI